jgi:hypothetical protein
LNKIGIFTLGEEVLVVERLLLRWLEESGCAGGDMIKRQGDDSLKATTRNRQY